MAGRLTKILARFSGCFLVTRSLYQSVRFALKIGKNNVSTIRLHHDRVIELRKNESDQEVFLTTFIDQFHRPPFYLGKSPVIVDLGANIGLTMIDLKQQYPGAKITGVEMDKDNFEFCKKNISGLSDCTVIHAAVWIANGTIDYAGENEQSYAVNKNNSEGGGRVSCITMDEVLQQSDLRKIDYIKMDIEGAEKALFLESNASQWLEKTRYISIELHDTPEVKNTELYVLLKNELEKNQFSVYKLADHWSALFAVNTRWQETNS